MKTKKLSIRLNGVPVGVLELNHVGKMQFTYHHDASSSVSMSMPLRDEPYNEACCEAFFGGLLPESETVRRMLGRMFRISPGNTFGLLKEIGHDCAGAISCHLTDEPVNPKSEFAIEGKILTNEELYKHIKDLPLKPLFYDVEGLRLSLAGVQDKAAVCFIDNNIIIPENNCPTSHLIKPSSNIFPGLVENEYLTLKLAKRVGLPVPNVTIKKINDISFLLIERYDRKMDERYISRIHQEDFCQALGIKSSRKYQNEGGPGFISCFDLLNQTIQPAIARNQMILIIIFNLLIGNMDAHAKNFSLLHHKENHITLAPFYDLVCTRAYSSLTSKMAMKIGRKYRTDEVDEKQFKLLCEQVNYRYVAFKKTFEKMADLILQAASHEINEMHELGMMHPIIENMKNFIESNIDYFLEKINA